MDTRVKQILGEYKSKEAVNTDTYLKIELNGSERLLPPDEINKVLDLTVQFDLERQSTTFYRIVTTINPLISNVLFNLTGNDTWSTFNLPVFLKTTYDSDVSILTYPESIKTHLKEKEGWYGYYSLPSSTGGLCIYNDMEPKRERFSFTKDITNVQNQQIKNWDVTITYPYTSDTENFLVKDGLFIVDKESVIVGGREMVALITPVSHNLNEGDMVKIKNTSNDGTYEVKRLGKDNGEFKSNYFCIDINFNSIILGQNSRMTKLYNDFESEYYFRKFKKVKTRNSVAIGDNDYDIFNLAFAQNIYADTVYQAVFNEDINVDGLVDNLGRPLSELYLTIIKTDSNNIFTKVSSGIESTYRLKYNTGNVNTYLKNIPVIQKIHNVSTAPSQTFTPLESDVKITNSDFYGDVVEYNKFTVAEVVLSDVQHRFNTVNRETQNTTLVPGPRPEGYYYKAHHLIRIRNFSTYIEEGDANTVGMPDYSVNLGDGRYFWRDLLNIGTTDVKIDYVNYPFVNGCHYLYNNFCFEVKRQDPFDNWDLYFSNFPPDPFGNSKDNNLIINSSNNVC